jgi:hypothetical protein
LFETVHDGRLPNHGPCKLSANECGTWFLRATKQCQKELKPKGFIPQGEMRKTVGEKEAAYEERLRDWFIECYARHNSDPTMSRSDVSSGGTHVPFAHF